MSQTTATGLQVPTSGDACDVPADLLTLGGLLDGVTLPLFGSTADRDTAYGITPFKICVVGTDIPTGTLYVRQGSSWYSWDPTYTDFSNITVNTGFAANGVPRCRKQNGMVVFQDGFTTTGMTASATNTAVGVVPSGFRPQYAHYEVVANAGAASIGIVVINANGNIDIRTNTTLGSYFRLDGVSYPVYSS